MKNVSVVDNWVYAGIAKRMLPYILSLTHLSLLQTALQALLWLKSSLHAEYGHDSVLIQ